MQRHVSRTVGDKTTCKTEAAKSPCGKFKFLEEVQRGLKSMSSEVMHPNDGGCHVHKSYGVKKK
ncbi:MAG: hypothetical protein RR090_12580 [Niameybacter sp.]|uniref:hypothetical protein n=1 Tax=Niameybacter sp. TaxID=2033640 RepID=UPI002FC983FF